MLEVGIPRLNAHLNALQEASAHPLRGVCWHFTGTSRTYCSTLRRAGSQLLQATGLVAVDDAIEGSPRPVVQRVEIRTVRSPLLTATSAVAWRSCVLASSSTCVKCQQTPRRGWAPAPWSAFRCALSVGMPTSKTRANKSETHRSHF